jgi:hypothetical protein
LADFRSTPAAEFKFRWIDGSAYGAFHLKFPLNREVKKIKYGFSGTWNLVF